MYKLEEFRYEKKGDTYLGQIEGGGSRCLSEAGVEKQDKTFLKN